MIDEDIKKRILEKGIISSEEEWNESPPIKLEMAKVLLLMSNIPQLISSSVTDYEKVKFDEETQALNDMIELKDVDKVSPNKSFESDNFKINIPVELIPFIREGYSSIMKKENPG